MPLVRIVTFFYLFPAGVLLCGGVLVILLPATAVANQCVLGDKKSFGCGSFGTAAAKG